MKTKKVFRFFTIFNHEKEERFLRRMHQSGWKFVRSTPVGIYHFEKCEPGDVVYQLDYNEEKAASKEEYIQMFADCGWEYVHGLAGYNYFRKSAAAMKGEEKIYCDDSSRLAMMDRIFKGRLIPLLVIFFSVVIPHFVLGILNGNYKMSVFYALMLVTYIAIFIRFAVAYYRQKNSSKE